MDKTERALEMLNEVLRRKMNSPATYILESSPYVREADRPVVEAIEAVSATARRHAEEAARRILLLEGVPHSGSYDPSVADSNYLSVCYLLGQLIVRLEKDIALFKEYQDQCEVLEAKDVLAMVIEDDTAHCHKLTALRDQMKTEHP